MKMYEVETHNYGHGVVSYVLNLPDKHEPGRYLAVTVDTDGSLLIPRTNSAVSLSAKSIEILRSFIDSYVVNK